MPCLCEVGSSITTEATNTLSSVHEAAIVWTNYFESSAHRLQLLSSSPDSLVCKQLWKCASCLLDSIHINLISLIIITFCSHTNNFALIFVHYLPHAPVQGSASCWSPSQLSVGKRWTTAWTRCFDIAQIHFVQIVCIVLVVSKSFLV